MDTNQNNKINNLPEGLIIRTKEGKLKRVQNGQLVDLETKKIPEEERPRIEPQPFQPVRPISSSKTPAFYYYTEDEEEIKAHQDKLNGLTKEPEIETEALINKIIEKDNLSFSDEILKKRFFNIIKSRLDNVRESVETEEALKRSTKIGGVGLEENTVYKIMIDVENEAAKIHDYQTVKGLKIEKEPVPSLVKEAPPPHLEIPPGQRPSPKPPVVPFKPEKPSPPVAKKEKPMERLTPEFPKPTLTEVFKPSLPQKEIKIKVEEKEKPSAFFIGPKPTFPRITRPPGPSRPRLDDIKTTLKTIGPVEELKELTLKDFRRLGQTLSESMEKIKEKINLLEEESFSLKTDGIKAWRSCEVNQLYLAMGYQSIEEGKSIKNIIEQRKTEGRPYLTEEEFMVMADLNSQLSY